MEDGLEEEVRRDEERPLSKGEKFTTVRALDQVVGKLVAPAEPATLLVAGKWRQLEGGIDDDTVILHHAIQSQRCVRNAAVGRRRVPVTLIPRPQARQNFPSTPLLPANLCKTERDVKGQLAERHHHGSLGLWSWKWRHLSVVVAANSPTLVDHRPFAADLRGDLDTILSQRPGQTHCQLTAMAQSCSRSGDCRESV